MGSKLSINEDYSLIRTNDGHSEEITSQNSPEAHNLDEIVPLNQINNELNHESIEMEEVTSNSENINCNNNEYFVKYFDDSDESINNGSYKMIKFQFMDSLPEINEAVLQLMNQKYQLKSIVLILISKNDEEFAIFWKSKEIENFLEIRNTKKLNWEENLKLCEYTAEFLVNCLRNNQLGILSELSSDSGLKSINIDLLADSRNFNLLLLAAEKGNLEMVKIFLQLSINTASNDNKVDCQSLAMENKHEDVIYVLMQNNLTFPTLLDADNCTGKLKEFCELTNEVHRLIISKDAEQLAAILPQQNNLCHFYNFENKSALRVAIESQSFDVYDFLLSKSFSFGSHENPSEYYEELEMESKRTLRDIQNKYSQPFAEKHIHTLMSKSTACFDEKEAKDKRNLVQRAFEILSVNPFIQIILKIVATSKNLKIVFDFNREAVNVIDPTRGEETQGICYFAGKIFIGAKQLLDPRTENVTLGVLAHELCHFAMTLVYKNHAKPYNKQDKKTMEEFEEISRDCEEKSAAEEEVIGSIYECYPEKFHHGELIVRVVHLMALYRNLPEKLTELRGTFIKLFEFYENKTVPDMEKALPELEGRDEQELKIKDKKIYKYKKMSHICGILAIIGIITVIVVGSLLYTPTYRFGDLAIDKKNQVFDAPIKYKGVDLNLCDLFPKNSTVYQNLTSEHISQIFQKITLDFGHPHMKYLDQQVSHKWKNLAGKLKEKFLGSNLNFQGEIVKFKDLFESCPEAFNALTSQQIVNVLSGKELKIGEKFESENKFYVERKFIPEDAKLIDFEYENGHDYIYNYETVDEYVKNRTKNKSFQEFYEEFLKKDFNEISQIYEKIQQNSYFKILNYDLNHKTYIFMHKASTETVEQAQKDKILILSSEAGAGKTVTFEKLAKEIKSKFPTFWVSYIDLPKFTNLYKSGTTAEDLLKQILRLSSEKNEFEAKIFEESFKSGNLILLWNAFDEISPIFNGFVLNVFKSIHKTTKNVQFVCTRPLYSDQLRTAFKVRTWQLVPFNEEKKIEFLREFFKFENVSSDKIDENIEKVEKIVEKLQYDDRFYYNFETPLMLKLIAEIHKSEELFESGSIFGIFEAFLKKKLKIWLRKSTDVVDNASKLLFDGSLNKIFQKFALLNEFRIFSSTTLGLKLGKLQIMQKEFPKDFQIEEISQLGILFVNGKNNFQFSHKTFAEFFVAQFFIENIFDIDGSVNSDEAELRLELFFSLTQPYGDVQQIITDFMSSYLQARPQAPKKFNSEISKLLRTKFKNFFIRFLDTTYPKVFDFLFEFFKPDHDLLVDLLQVHEPETFFTAIFNPNHFALFTNPEDIKNLAQNCLTDAEMQKFLTGKNQKGKILSGIHFYGLLGVTKVHDDFKDEIEKLKGASFWEFFPKVKDQLTVEEQKELFVAALSSKIYLYYDKMFSTADFSKYEKLWTNFENLLTKTEMQNALGDALLLYFETAPDRFKDAQKFLNFLIKKAENFLTNSQIFEIFLSKNILHEAHWDDLSFEILWNFLNNHTNEEKRREILLQDDFDDKSFYFRFSYNELKESYSSYEYQYYYYDFTPFKIFHRALFFGNPYTFDFTKEIYENYFKKSEIQEIILNSNDFLYYVVGKSFEDPFKKFASFLEEIFEGNEKKLKEFLERKIEPTNLSVFELVEDFRGLPWSQSDWFNNLETLSELYEKIKNH